MLIRYIDGGLREIPDEVAVRVLADPTCDDKDLLKLNTHWVNVIVHGTLGTIFEPGKSFEENIKYAMDEFLPWEPRPKAREDAIRLIKQYHIEIKDEDIGMFPAEDMI